jgi:hypothetical protein
LGGGGFGKTYLAEDTDILAILVILSNFRNFSDLSDEPHAPRDRTTAR